MRGLTFIALMVCLLGTAINVAVYAADPTHYLNLGAAVVCAGCFVVNFAMWRD